MGARLARVVYGWDRIKRAHASLLVTVLIAAIQCLLLAADPYELARIYELLGLRRDEFLGGKLWQIASYGLLHGGFAHMGLNALCLILLGSKVEDFVGSFVLLKIVVWGIVAGGVSHLLLAPGGMAAPILVGISGSCAGLLLALITLSPDSRLWPIPLTASFFGMLILGSELFLALVNPALGVPWFSEIGALLKKAGFEAWFTIGHACHFGGGVAGYICARRYLRPKVPAARLRQRRQERDAKREMERQQRLL